MSSHGLIILLIILSICLVLTLIALILQVVRSITISEATGGGGTSLPFADVVTSRRTGAVCVIGCECHSMTMFPGMRCMDCYGEDCDEGTQQ